MKYTSHNHLEDFVFHDALFSFISLENNTLIISAQYLNIHKGTAQNANDYDAEIASAKISFECFDVHSLEPLRAYKRDTNGNLYTDEPQIIFHGKEAEEIFIRELKSTVSLNGLNIQNENGRVMIEIETNLSATLFIAIYSCTDVKVEWDEYSGRAWYEK